MKPSHTVTPRQMSDGQFWLNADPIEHYPESGTQKVYGYLLALGIGMGLAAALVAWWSA